MAEQMIKNKDYSVVLKADSNVSPYARVGVVDLSQDVALYGSVLSITPVSSNEKETVVCKITPSNKVYVYASIVEDVILRAIFVI